MSKLALIASSASTGDYYTWEINPSGTTGSDYQVGLQSISKPYVKDVSNTYFTITPAEHRASYHGYFPEWWTNLETRNVSCGHLDLLGQSRADCEDNALESRR